MIGIGNEIHRCLNCKLFSKEIPYDLFVKKTRKKIEEDVTVQDKKELIKQLKEQEKTMKNLANKVGGILTVKTYFESLEEIEELENLNA
jgi:hypothetical protein